MNSYTPHGIRLLKQPLATNLGNVFIQVLDLQVLLGRVFTALKFSKPKIIRFFSKAKSIIRKFVTMVGREVGLSYLLKYVAIYFGVCTHSFPSKNRTDAMVTTGLRWNILEFWPLLYGVTPDPLEAQTSTTGLYDC